MYKCERQNIVIVVLEPTNSQLLPLSIFLAFHISTNKFSPQRHFFNKLLYMNGKRKPCITGSRHFFSHKKGKICIEFGCIMISRVNREIHLFFGFMAQRQK